MLRRLGTGLPTLTSSLKPISGRHADHATVARNFQISQGSQNTTISHFHDMPPRSEVDSRLGNAEESRFQCCHRLPIEKDNASDVLVIAYDPHLWGRFRYHRQIRRAAFSVRTSADSKHEGHTKY